MTYRIMTDYPFQSSLFVCPLFPERLTSTQSGVPQPD